MTLNPDAIRQTWQSVPLDKEDFIELSKKSTEEQIATLDARLTAIERVERETFWEKGAIVKYVKTVRLWAEWTDSREMIGREANPHYGEKFKSLESWMAGGAGNCRTSRYDALTWFEETAHLPPEKVKLIDRKNTKRFLKIPKKRQSDPLILEAAATQSAPHFDAYTAKHVPEAHLDISAKITFNLERGQREAVDAAIQRGMERLETESPEATLTAICIEIQHEWDREDQAEAQAAHA